MRAAVYDGYGGPEVLRVAEIPEPVPGPGQVRVRVRAGSVNPIDWKVRSGLVPVVSAFPAGTGTDAAGVVDAVGDGVTGTAVGDEVLGVAVDRAGAAEACLLHHWAAKPADMPWDIAASLPLATETALRALRVSGAAEGELVLVDGASGAVGLATLQFARELGIRTVGTASPANFDLLRSVGAIPVGYGAWSPDELRQAGVDRVDRALDYSGRSIPALIELVGDPDLVTGIVDHKLGPQLGIRDTASSPTAGAFDAVGWACEMWSASRFTVRIGPSFALDQIGAAQEANRLGAQGKVIVWV